MKEVLFKDMTSHNRMRRELSIVETMEAHGSVAKIVKRCLYVVKGLSYYDGIGSMKLDGVNCPPRQIFIRKIQNTHDHNERFLYKVTGELYAVSKNVMFTVAFRHSFEMNIQK